MRVLILGGDGYLGWPTAMHMSLRGHEVCVVDNYLRRKISRETSSEPLLKAPDLEERASIFNELTGYYIKVVIADCSIYEDLSALIKEWQPDTVIHYAEQPSAPYSMFGLHEARLTFKNNLDSTFNVIWAIKEHAPDCHLIKLGTMGEYGTPNIDIEEGWIDIQHNGRSEKFLYPRQAGSLYHTTKVLDTDLIWFYVRVYGLRVTDLMQGPVYGLSTNEANIDDRLLPFFHYDDIFGTVVNRFLIQAIVGIPLTVYGEGGQTRGYINIKDTVQCVDLAMSKPAESGELRIMNQFTEQFTVNELANRVSRVGNKIGLNVQIQSLKNPRKEAEEHYYNAKHSGLMELGLEPHYMTDEVIEGMLRKLLNYKSSIDVNKILPRVTW